MFEGLDRVAVLFFLGILPFFSMAQFSVTPDPTYHTTPPSGVDTALHPNRINLVILSEGFTNGMNSTFQDRCDGLLHALFEEDIIPQAQGDSFPYASTPFPEYRKYFNVYRVWVESEGPVTCVNGAHSMSNFIGCGDSIPQDTANPPYFGYHFDNGGIHRLILPDSGGVENVVNIVRGSSMFNDDASPLLIAVLINTGQIPNVPFSDNQYFGASGIPAQWNGASNVGVFAGSINYEYDYVPWNQGDYVEYTYALHTLVHEIGHALGQVLDEYWYDVSALGWTNDAPNRWQSDANPSVALPWNHWITPQPEHPEYPIGIHKHVEISQCDPTIFGDTVQNFFKPTTYTDNGRYYCKMGNYDYGRQYCSVCKEAIVERIHELVSPIDSVLPALTDTAIGSETLTLRPYLVEPDSSWMEVRWLVNDQLDTVIQANGAAAGETDFGWPFECDNSNLVSGINHIKAVVFDLTGDTASTNDRRFVRVGGHQEHRDTITWTVYFDSIPNADLWMKDYNEDVGDEPWSPFGWFFDHCPDMKVQNTQEAGGYDWSDLTNESPHYDPDSSSFIYAQVRNRGCATSDGGDTVRVYTTYRGSGDSWEAGYWGNPVPSPWGYQIGYGLIPSIAGGDSAIVEIEWDWAMDTIHPDTVNNWHSCLLARIENVAVDPMWDTTNITNWIHYNNNIAMLNVHILDLNFVDDIIQMIGGKPYVGAWAYVDNNGVSTADFDLHYDTDGAGKGVLSEAEIVVSFGIPSGYDLVDALDNATLGGLAQLDSVTFLVTGTRAVIEGLEIPADTYFPAFVGFAFLTEEVSATYDYIYHLSQYSSSDPSKNIAGQHYDIRRVSRTLFYADAGDDETILTGDTITLSANDIGEDALYYWLDESGTVVGTGDEIDVSPSSTTTYTLEVIAEADGYKDYDDVTVNVTNGLITSIAPNPASSTTTVYYETTGVSTVKLKVVEVGSMMQVDNFTVTAGTGSKVITVSGYNTGAHIITLEGDSQDLDAKTLIVQ